MRAAAPRMSARETIDTTSQASRRPPEGYPPAGRQTRIAAGPRRRPPFLLIQRDAVPDRSDDKRDQEARRGHGAAHVEQEPLAAEDGDRIGAHQLQRAERQQDTELRRADLEKRQLERAARMRGEG